MADSSTHVMELQEALHTFLNPREQAEFVEILSAYHSRNNIHDLVHNLRILLDTPAKLHLAQLLRKSVPRRDLRLYDELMNCGYVTMSLPRRAPSHRNGLTHSRSTGNLYRPGSTLSVPATTSKQQHQQHYGTLPSRNATRALQRQQSVPQDLNRSIPSDLNRIPASGATMWDAGLAPRTKRIQMRQPADPNESLGFSIRGGAEHGIGIYVSYVDVESLAERQGLVPGDQILSVNGLSFIKMFHDEAAKIIKHAGQLSLEVRNVGRVPGSFETHQTYTWVDAIGRTVSPPPEVDRIGRYENAGERKSGLMLLKDSDERKVHLVLTDNRGLGLMIRGGNEFGLGIYITSIDPGSVAENAGIKIGDQILDVNGQSFLDISHRDAAATIKSSRRMVITVKEVGKLPFARTTFDHTKWVSHQTLPRKPPPPKSPSISGKGTFGRSTNVEKLKKFLKKSVFMRGAGSQLMLSSMSNKQTQYGMVEEKGRSLLNDAEQSTLSYYLNEYQQGTISTEGLVLALNELFNTQAKYSLMSEIRGMIVPKDLEKFDELLLERDIDSVKSPSALLSAPDQISNHSLDSLSNGSVGSGLDSLEGAGIFSPLPPSDTPAPKEFQDNQDDDDLLDPLLAAIEQINGAVEGSPEPRFEEHDLPPVEPRSAFKPIHPSATTASMSSSVTSAPRPTVVVAEVHQPPLQSSSEQSYKSDEMRSPSEDSGVEVNGVGNGDLTDQQLHPTLNQAKVTVSTSKPVVINDKMPNKSGSVPIATLSSVVRPTPANHTSRQDHVTASQLRVERREGSLSGNSSQYPSPGRNARRSSHGSSRDKSPGRPGSLTMGGRSIPQGYPKDRVGYVILRKLKPTLGIAIEGGANTRQPLPRIINIQPGGSAYESGGLRVGQVILEVNRRSMKGLEHREAAKIIAEAFKNKATNQMELTVLDVPPK